MLTACRAARRAAVLLALLLVPLLSGCLTGADDPLDGTEAASLADESRAAAANGTGPGLDLRLQDLRSDPLDPPRLGATIVLDPTPNGTWYVHLTWIAAGAELQEAPIENANRTEWTVTRTFDLPLGTHRVALEARLSRDDAAPDGARDATAGIEVTAWAPIRLIINASEEHASDQNVFWYDHPHPYAPWAEENALDLLHRAADTHGFTVQTQYRSDLDATFVDGINGTAFRWDVEGAVSRNWMILVDGEPSSSAADRTRPEPEATLEYRYVRCYATGRCDDL